MVTKKIHINIPTPVIDHVIALADQLKQAIGLPDSSASIHSIFNLESHLKRITQLDEIIPGGISEKKILELGSGVGMLAIIATLAGINFQGTEPASNSYTSQLNATTALLHANNLPLYLIKNTEAERLPFADKQFDLVVSFQVLEHVKDVQQVLLEAFRVLKPGGYIFMTMPNYASFTEGHYGITWLPLFAYSKPLAKLWVKLCGRNSTFLNEINFVTPRRLKKIAAHLPGQFTFLSSLSHYPKYTYQNIIICKQQEKITVPLRPRYTGLAHWVHSLIAKQSVTKSLHRIGMARQIIMIAQKNKEQV